MAGRSTIKKERPPVIQERLRILDFGDCPYLPDRSWWSAALYQSEDEAEALGQLMQSGFRRLGHLFYTPVCPGCQACISLRIPVQRFRANKNQRQVWKRNQDLQCSTEPRRFDPEKFALYQKYQSLRWGRPESDEQSFREVYIDQPGQGLDFVYRQQGRLLGFDILDVTPIGLSSVYFVWDCDPKRSLGIYSVLKAIEWCQQQGCPYLYLGLYVEGNASMKYKASFHPHERLYRGQTWVEVTS